jgi:1,4-alpha-glucan branching enzyme/maltooligosyltrehalose trehalohydrolase
VHALIDDSDPSFLSELSTAIRHSPGLSRPVHLILENDNNEASLLGARPGQPGQFDAQWNDDAHHAFHTLLTGEADGYYAEYAYQPVEQLGRALTQGFVFQGEPSPVRGGRPRGEPSGHLRPTSDRFQNHDRSATARDRLPQVTDPDRLRATIAIVLLHHQCRPVLGEEGGV